MMPECSQGACHRPSVIVPNPLGVPMLCELCLELYTRSIAMEVGKTLARGRSLWRQAHQTAGRLERVRLRLAEGFLIPSQRELLRLRHGELLAQSVEIYEQILVTVTDLQALRRRTLELAELRSESPADAETDPTCASSSPA